MYVAYYGEVKMETNRKMILAMTAVALMVAVAFVGFITIGDGGSDAETSNVAKINNQEYATLEAAFNAVTTGQTIELISGASVTDTITVSGGKEVTLDLADYELKFTSTKNARLFVVGTESEKDTSKLIVKDGKITATGYSNAYTATIKVLQGASIQMDDVEMATNGAGLFPVGDAAKVTINRCQINAGAVCVGTNASVKENGGVIIDITGSELKTQESDDYTVYINVKSTLTIKESELTGHRQVLMVRAGDARVEDTTLNYIPTFVPTAAQDYESKAWGSGNEVPMAAIVVGNHSSDSAYDISRSLTVEDVRVNIIDTQSRSSYKAYNLLYSELDKTRGNTDTCTIMIVDGFECYVYSDTAMKNTTKWVYPVIKIKDNVDCARPFDVSTAGELQTAVCFGGDILIADNITTVDRIKVPTSVSIDLNGKKITADSTAFQIPDIGNITFELDGEDSGSSVESKTAYVLFTGYGSNVVSKITGGTYVADYGFVQYAVGDSALNISDVKITAVTCGVWCGGTNAKPTVTIKDCDITVTGTEKSSWTDMCVGIELGCVSKATLTDVTVNSTYIGIEIKSGDVTINGQSKITSKKYLESTAIGSGTNGGSVTAIAINSGYLNHTGATEVKVAIADTVDVQNTADDAKHTILITSNTTNAYAITVTALSETCDAGFLFADKTNTTIAYNDAAVVHDLDGLKAAVTGKKSAILAGDVTVTGSEKISLSDGTYVDIIKGKTLTLNEGAILTGKIIGPGNNTLVANNMKAGDKGITITGGSLIINGVVKDDVKAGDTIKVSGESIKIEGTLDAGVTLIVEKGTSVVIETADGKPATLTVNGTITNNGVIKVEQSSTLTIDATATLVNQGTVELKDTSTVTGTIDNAKGIVGDNRTTSDTVTVTGGTVITDSTEKSEAYAKEGATVIDGTVQDVKDGDTVSATNGVFVITNDVTLGDDGLKIGMGGTTYILLRNVTLSIGDKVSLSLISESSSVIKYEIDTPNATGFTAVLKAPAGFDGVKVKCDNKVLDSSDVRYDPTNGEVTFSIDHNSIFTITGYMGSTSTSTSSGETSNTNLAFVGGIVVLVVAILALAVVIKRN